MSLLDRLTLAEILYRNSQYNFNERNYMEELTDEINIKVRSEVLRYSLFIENIVNGLLLGHLAIFDKDKTKNFGNKAGISFKSKIDLLYDLDILNKDQLNSLDLLMIFRNKFLHNLESNSFGHILKTLDNGIVNRFKKYISQKDDEYTEKDYEEACLNLYLENAKMLLSKYKERENFIKAKKEVILAYSDAYILLIDKSFNTISDLMTILSESNLNNPEMSELTNKIVTRCREFTENKEILDFSEKINTIASEEVIAGLLK